MKASSDTRLKLQIDLQGERILSLAGYRPHDLTVGRDRLQAAIHHQDGEIDYFFRGTLYGFWSENRFFHWLRAFDLIKSSDWLGSQGDFNLVVWNRKDKRAVAITDRVGAHRLYVHCNGFHATVTSRIGDQARLQSEAEFDHQSIHTMLTMSYPLDPWSILRDTWIAGVGTAVVCSTAGAEPENYYSPVTLHANNFDTVEDCVGTLDTVIRETIAKHLTADARPIVMLSGGIDSVVLLRYVKELAGGRAEAFTFAVEGRQPNELNEAAIAAKYYGIEHHRLIIPSADIEALTRRALMNMEVFGYGGLEHQGINDYLQGFGETLTVIRGEDTRLHTPPLDLPTRVGLGVNASNIRTYPAARFAWRVHGLLRQWPLRRGRNYLRYVADKTDLHDDLSLAILTSLLRFRYPVSWLEARPVPDRMEALRQGSPTGSSMEQLFRWAVSVAYRLQYTDDMHSAHCAVDTPTTTLVLPFYDPDVVQATNRVPLRLAMKRTYVSPRKTRSPFPVADKFILRQLMKGAAPPELLYRRKSTAPAAQALFEHAGRTVILAALAAWSPALLEKLEEPSRALAAYYLDQIFRSGVSTADDLSLTGMALRLLSLSVVSWHVDHPTEDLQDAAMALPPWPSN